DPESWRVQAAGLCVRELSRRPSSWRADGSLGDLLATSGVVGIEQIDTRALTVRLREHGAMRAAVSTVETDPAVLVERVRAAPGMAGADWARSVSTAAPYAASEIVGPPPPFAGSRYRIAAYDFGIK